MNHRVHSQIIVGCATVFLFAGCANQEMGDASLTREASGSKEIPGSDLGWSVTVIGELGEPLGTMTTVTGRCMDPEPLSKAHEICKHLRADSVNGRPLIKGTQLCLKWYGPGPEIEFEIGKNYRLKGFETGAFGGAPYAPDETGMSFASQGYGFVMSFEVVSAVGP